MRINMIYVTKAQYIDQYKIHLTFNNNKSGVIDLKDVVEHDHRAIFHELIDIQKFKQFTVEMDTIVWKNGLDLAPEFLYKKCNHN